MKSTEAKKEYNALLKRYNKATKYFEDEKVSQQAKEKQLLNFLVVLTGLNYLLSEIKTYTSIETMGGFEI